MTYQRIDDRAEPDMPAFNTSALAAAIFEALLAEDQLHNIVSGYPEGDTETTTVDGEFNLFSVARRIQTMLSHALPEQRP